MGGCSEKQSLEHLVSQSIYDTTKVSVQGFAWCKEEKVIGLGSMGRKILCTRHNSALSPLDTEAGRFVDAIIYANKLSAHREKLKEQRWSIHRKRMDGHLLERWMLKTLVNVAHDEAAKFAMPLEEIVQIIFGRKLLPAYAGLHVLAKAGDNLSMGRTFSFAPMYKEDSLLAGLLTLGGINFVIALTDVRMAFVGKRLNFHHRHLQYKVRKHVSCALNLAW